MPEVLINCLVLLLVVAITLFSIRSSPRYKRWADQKATDRRRKAAHAGKVKCEDPDCDDIATRFTPNGYFCEWHWEPMSKKGKVTWNHVLYHSIRRS